MVGVARTRLDDQQFRDLMTAAVPESSPGWATWSNTAAMSPATTTTPTPSPACGTSSTTLDEELGLPGNRTYYLATIPAMFGQVAGGLGAGRSQPAPPAGRRPYAW